MNRPACKTLLLLLTIFFIATSCNFIKDAKTKLAHYCPGLKINTSGISYAYSNGKTFYAISYDQSSQEVVKAYFENKESGFAQDKDGDFYEIKMDDEPVIDRSDNVLAKTFKHAKGNTEVIFNETTRRIIIIENGE